MREDIILRRIRSGLSRLEQHGSYWSHINPAGHNSPQFVWRVAQWVDVGYRDISFVRQLLEAFPAALRRDLTLHNYVYIRVAEGLSALYDEEPDLAIAHFNVVLQFEEELGDPELFAIANFWKARAQRSKGEYEDALDHCIHGRDLARQCQFDRMAAVIQTLEAWLYFQKGKHKDALRILDETIAVLSETDDALVLGNIESTYGRIFRQEGRYDRAIEHFHRAIDEYRKVDPLHPNLARTLSNIAYVKRLVALEFKRKIEADVARRRNVPARTPSDAAATREQFTRLRDEAFGHLDEAEAIYQVHPNRRGAATVHLHRAFLHLDSGSLDQAGDEALATFAIGEKKEDHIMMARARIFQCMVENAKLDEGLEDDPRHHAQAALDYIRDAVEFAGSTQNRRLLGRAHTWHGLTLSNEFFNQRDAALAAYNIANSHLDHRFHDTAWEDLQVLKGRVLKAASVDEVLLAWSQGAVGDKTFKQISEEFAELIIPKVWANEGRKVARVAAKLSISPKKVRRALIRAGLLNASSAD